MKSNNQANSQLQAILGLALLGATSATFGCGSGGTADSPDARPPAVDAQAEEEIDFSDIELAVISTLSPLAEVLPVDSTNSYADNPTAAALGQMLFFDKDLSGAIGPDSTLGVEGMRHATNCATCHVPRNWYVDLAKERTPMGLDGREEVNILSLVNTGYNKWTMWEGGTDSYWAQAMEDLEGALDGNRGELAHVLFDKYKAEYNAVFPAPLPEALAANAVDGDRFPPMARPANFWEDAGEAPGPYESMAPADQAILTRILVNYGKAMQAYERVLVSRNASFDRFVAGDQSAISASAKRGLKIFVGDGRCSTCHKGPNFSDDKFHNITVPAMGDEALNVPFEDQIGYYDGVDNFLNGAFATYNIKSEWSDDPSNTRIDGIVVEDKWKYTFRTQTLRGVADTAPYMHSGQFATLREVVEFYSDGGQESGYAGVKDRELKVLDLSEQEIDDLVAFLETLSGEPVTPALLVDTSR